jgi:hypothetical protein
MFNGLTRLLCRHDFFFKDHAYDETMVKMTLLISLPEDTETMDKAGGDETNLQGQDIHRDFDPGQFQTYDHTAKTSTARHVVPGITVLICLMNGTRFRFYTESHTLIVTSAKKDWPSDNEGVFIEIILNRGMILVMHGYLLHAGCDYAKLNIRCAFFLKLCLLV